MVRDLVSQIDPKKELKCWTILIIALLKEQSTLNTILEVDHLRTIDDMFAILAY
jgi:hypothetical protein